MKTRAHLSIGFGYGIFDARPTGYSILMALSRVIHKLSRRSGFVAALAVALLMAQAVTAAHDPDAAEHGPGQSCEVCLAASVLGGANLAAIPLPPLVATAQSVATTSQPLAPAGAPRDARARSPPSLA